MNWPAPWASERTWRRIAPGSCGRGASTVDSIPRQRQQEALLVELLPLVAHELKGGTARHAKASVASPPDIFQTAYAGACGAVQGMNVALQLRPWCHRIDLGVEVPVVARLGCLVILAGQTWGIILGNVVVRAHLSEVAMKLLQAQMPQTL